MSKEITGWFEFLDIRKSKPGELPKAKIILQETGLSGRLLSCEDTVLLAELGTHVIGTVSVSRSGYIHSLAVLDFARRRGVGSMLLKKVEGEAKNSGIDNVCLVPKRASLDRLTSFYVDRGYKSESILMTKTLT